MPSLERITHIKWTYRKKVAMAMTSGSIVLVPFICGVMDGKKWRKGIFEFKALANERREGVPRPQLDVPKISPLLT